VNHALRCLLRTLHIPAGSACTSITDAATLAVASSRSRNSHPYHVNLERWQVRRRCRSPRTAQAIPAKSGVSLVPLDSASCSYITITLSSTLGIAQMDRRR
jgi:hypothetical protein